MSNPQHEQIIRNGYAVAEAMDVPGFVNAFTPDGTVTDEAFGNVFTGPKDLATMLQVFGNAFPDMHREIQRLYSVDDMVIVELALQGTHKGPLAVPGGFIPPTGKRMSAHCCDVFRLVGGKIKTFNCYWSAATVLAQLGVLGNLEGAATKAG
ncbi:MAG TPA: ester cyclase [Vicinamibacterales bacterium]|nr:ester cyclase [Vicinamibacterales bacterium]